MLLFYFKEIYIKIFDLPNKFNYFQKSWCLEMMISEQEETFFLTKLASGAFSLLWSMLWTTHCKKMNELINSL